MFTQILISVETGETRVALIEDNQLLEYYIERGTETRLSGNIYCGKVKDVLPGMQAAFINIGEEKNGFFYVGDITEKIIMNNKIKEISYIPVQDRKIEDIVKKGDKIIVQVYKEPVDYKGARLTTNLSISGIYMVYMPFVKHIGLSHRISDLEERERLRNIITSVSNEEEGFIIRTAAVGCEADKLKEEIEELKKIWQSTLKKIMNCGRDKLIMKEKSLSNRVVRDLINDDIDRISVDEQEEYKKIQEELNKTKPELVNRLEFYSDTTEPLFDKFSIENQIIKALRRRVELKSGGYLIFDQTEALTSIDINTGGFVGKKDIEDTAFKINMEAVTKIASQIRLRNLGGMIIVDLLDMRDIEHKQTVINTMEEVIKKDRCKTQIVELSELGLIELTRKREGNTLAHKLMIECPFCSGLGRILSHTTLRNRLIRMLSKEAGFGHRELIVQTTTHYKELLRDDKILYDYIKKLNLSIEFQALIEVSADILRVIPKLSDTEWKEE